MLFNDQQQVLVNGKELRTTTWNEPKLLDDGYKNSVIHEPLNANMSK